jgi:Helicase associated domain
MTLALSGSFENDIWDLDWQENFNLLLAYKSQYQHLRIPISYVTPLGVKLGLWASTRRQTFKPNNQRFRLKPFMDKNGKAKVGTDKKNEERIDLLIHAGFS